MKVGDTVMLCSVNLKKARPVKVVSVGPKLVKIEGDRVGYRKDNALTRSDGCGHSWLMTIEDYERRERVERAVVQLRALGVSLGGGPFRERAPEILEAVQKVLA